MKITKAIASIILSVTIFFSGINVVALTANDNVSSSAENELTFSSDKRYYIWLKQDTTSTDPLSGLRNLKYRWNINGGGNAHNAEVHLDYNSGDNCEMIFESVGDGYYGIRYEESSYWIDTEHDDDKTGRVLHQNSKDLKSDKYNQHFKFVPVSGETDTYYIMSRKGNNDLYVGIEDNSIKQYTKLVTADKSNAKKWIIKTTDDLLLTGYEEVLCGSKDGEYLPTSGVPVFTLNPENYLRDVNVHNDGAVIGDCLHLFYIGTSSKINAEWIESEKAYRLRSYSTNEKYGDGIWDIDDQSLDDGAVAHIWSNEGNDHKSQLWRFIPVDGKSGVYYIYNVNSKLYLSIEEQKDENDVKLVQSSNPFTWQLNMLNQNEYNAYSPGSDDEINAGNWMSKLPDSMYLSEVNMPGTHDAGAANMPSDSINQLSFTLCQQLYLDEQLNSGIRALDIRIDSFTAALGDNPNPSIVHGSSLVICQNRSDDPLQLKEVMDTAKDFLNSHPEETIIMTLKGDGLIGGDDNIADCVLKYIKDSSYPIYKPAKGEGGNVPTLGEVRGKIVFIRRLSLSDDYIIDLNKNSDSFSLIDAFGPDASEWDENHYDEHQYAQQVGNSKVYAQDNYSEKDATTKLNYFTGTITDATTRQLTKNGNAYLFNYSAAKDHLNQSRDIDYSLMSQELLNQPTKTSDKKTIGYVMANYIDPKLAKRIYMTNFINHTHEFRNGFCKICDQYQPATMNSDGVYEISNGGQMFWFAALTNGDEIHADFDKRNQNAKGILTKIISLENREWEPMHDFNGVFDGQNYAINDFSITETTSNAGLFGSSAGTIRNLSVNGEIMLEADGSSIGGIVGYADGAVISNVASNVHISNKKGTLKHVGGIVGSIGNRETTVEKCTNEGNISLANSIDCIGGIVGYTNAGGRIRNCANYAHVSSTANGAYIGGILGYVNNSNPTVQNCYNYATVTNGDTNTRCGAIIGWARDYGSVTNNYYYNVWATLAFGSDSKQGASAVSKNYDEFKSGEVAYLLNNKVTDGTQVWYQNIDNGKVPDIYPRFNGGTVYYLAYKDTYSNTYSEPPADPDAFDGDDDGNLIIRTYDDLVTLSEVIRSDYDVYGSQSYILENNIIAPDDSEWTAGIGSVSENKPFNGTFDGNGYCIIGLNVNSSEYGGLFEIIGESGCVKDLLVFDCDFKSTSKVSGGIAAINNGTIDHCISGVNLTSGIIHINSEISIDSVALNSDIRGEISGGVAGQNSGSITGCRNAAIVSGTQCGGIAGENTGKIYGAANSVRIGAASSSISGGIAGKNGGTIESSYNSGAINGSSEKSIGSIAGINGYSGAENPTVKNVFYSAANGLKAVGTDSSKQPDDTNKSKEKNSDFQNDAFRDEMNAVSDDTVVWTRNAKFNKGYPTIKGNYFEYKLKSAGSSITVEGNMHRSLNISYKACAKKDSEYSSIISALSGRKLLGVYSASLTDNDGNRIPAELWCQDEFKISVPADSKNVEFAGIDLDGQVSYYKPDSFENGMAVFTVAYPMTFALVESSEQNAPTNGDNTANVNSTDNNTANVNSTGGSTTNSTAATAKSSGSSPINTGSTVPCVVLLAALFSLVLIIAAKRRNKVG